MEEEMEVKINGRSEKTGKSAKNGYKERGD